MDKARNDNQDTTTYLWDYYFKVRVPQIQTTSVNYMRVYGTYLSGDKAVDKELAGQWLTTLMPIHQMVDHYKDGVQIKIVNTKDVKTIYEYISIHLVAWRDRLQRGVNIGGAPFDDLIAMDHFAHDLYEHAKYHFTEETINSIMAQELTSLVRLGPHNFFTSLNKPPQKEGLPEDGITRINHDPEPGSEYPEREGLADFLKDRIINLKSWRS